MFEEQKKTPEFQPCPPLDTIIALQKMLEYGLPHPVEEEADPLPRPALYVYTPYLPYSRQSRWFRVVQEFFQNAGYAFERSTRNFYLGFWQKKSVGGRSATGSD